MAGVLRSPMFELPAQHAFDVRTHGRRASLTGAQLSCDLSLTMARGRAHYPAEQTGTRFEWSFGLLGAGVVTWSGWTGSPIWMVCLAGDFAVRVDAR